MPGLSGSIAAFAEAVIDSSAWDRALAHLVAITGSNSAQMVGWSDGQTPAAAHFNLDYGVFDEWIAYGGPTLANPLVQAGARCGVGESVAEHEVLSSEARARSALWDLHERAAMPHVRSGKAWASGGLSMMVSVMRTRKQGILEGDSRRLYDELLRAAGSAARIGQALGAEKAQLVRGAFDLMRTPVIVIDSLGRVVAISAAAEEIVRQGSAIGVRRGALRAGTARSDRLLQAALRAMLAYAPDHDPTFDKTVTLQDEAGARIVVRLARLPLEGHSAGFSPRVLVFFEPWAPAQLTDTERAVAQALLGGRSLPEIAKDRRVSLETIRTQAKAVFAKAGVSSRLAFMARYGGGRRRL